MESMRLEGQRDDRKVLEAAAAAAAAAASSSSSSSNSSTRLMKARARLTVGLTVNFLGVYRFGGTKSLLVKWGNKKRKNAGEPFFISFGILVQEQRFRHSSVSVREVAGGAVILLSSGASMRAAKKTSRSKFDMKDFTRINCLHVAQLPHKNRRFSTRLSCRASNKSETRTIRRKLTTASSPPIFLFQISE